MEDTALIKKLLIKPGFRGIVLNPPDGYLTRLGSLPLKNELAGKFDFVHLFVKNKDEVQLMGPKAVEAVKQEGVLWVSYPKGSSKIKTDINRDKGWDSIKAMGFEGVSLISIDETWSAMRFRPSELSKRRT
ncbi:MAG: hypothetical protein ACYC21_09250 [Eubacteriales bacterium]